MCGLMSIVLFSAVAVVGCKLVLNCFRNGIELSSFPHDVHMEDMECLDCHGEVTNDGLRSFPAREECSDCHDAESDEALLAKFFTGDAPTWVHAGRQNEEVIFDHALHAGDGEESCSKCHEDVADSSSLWSSMKMDMDTCEDCHVSEGRSREDCAVCHREIREDVQPATHGAAWTLQHGLRSREGCFRTADRCDLCHMDASCDDCHQTNPPRSHNHFWRGRGHGLVAGIDRSRCFVCHDQDTCDRCHSSTRPRTHTATFGSPLNRHCVGCHLPLTVNENCRVCHVSTPGHDMAPVLPGNATHNTATQSDCRTCHIPLPHLDNGQSCRFCHF